MRLLSLQILIWVHRAYHKGWVRAVWNALEDCILADGVNRGLGLGVQNSVEDWVEANLATLKRGCTVVIVLFVKSALVYVVLDHVSASVDLEERHPSEASLLCELLEGMSWLEYLSDNDFWVRYIIVACCCSTACCVVLSSSLVSLESVLWHEFRQPKQNTVKLNIHEGVLKLIETQLT